MTFPASGEFAVLDIETAPDECLLALRDRRSASESGGRATLHAVVAACVMRFRIDGLGRFSALAMSTFDAEAGGEAGILEAIHSTLAPVATSGGGLITFNGRAHDIPVVTRRCASHWMFFGDLEIWRSRSVHLDLMTDASWCGAGKWSSLVDSCAAFGVDATPQAARPTRQSSADPRTKCEVDVISTYVLALHEFSMRAASPGPVVRGWDALATHLAKSRSPRLLAFARHPHVTAARRRLPLLEG